MSEKRFSFIRFWEKYVGTFVKWALEEKRLVYRYPKMLIILALLIIVVNALGLVVGLGIIYVPRIVTLIILTCLIVPPILLLSTVVITPKLITRFLEIALTLSVLFCLIIFGAGIFSLSVTRSLPAAERKSLFPNNTQFPLGELRDIAVDNNGSIYLAIQGYSRI